MYTYVYIYIYIYIYTCVYLSLSLSLYIYIYIYIICVYTCKPAHLPVRSFPGRSGRPISGPFRSPAGRVRREDPNTTLYHTILFHTIPYHAVLHYPILYYYIVLYCRILCTLLSVLEQRDAATGCASIAGGPAPNNSKS